MIARTLRLAAVLLAAATFFTWVASGTNAGQHPESVASAPSTVASTIPAVPGTTAASPGVSPAAPLPALESLRIKLPRLAIDLPLGLGDIERDVPRDRYAGGTPEQVALVFPGSAPLGTGGNTYVYAHARVGMFLSLWNVRVGDSVLIYSAQDAGVQLRYTIVRVVPRVDPSDTTWLDPNGPERLTLQTSTGPNPGDPRFMAVAARDAVPPAGSATP